VSEPGGRRAIRNQDEPHLSCASGSPVTARGVGHPTKEASRPTGRRLDASSRQHIARLHGGVEFLSVAALLTRAIA
jgi:hypothetical protein